MNRHSESPISESSLLLQSPLATPSSHATSRFLDNPDDELEKFTAELASKPNSLFKHYKPPTISKFENLRGVQRQQAQSGAIFYEWRCA